MRCDYVRNAVAERGNDESGRAREREREREGERLEREREGREV